MTASAAVRSLTDPRALRRNVAPPATVFALATIALLLAAVAAGVDPFAGVEWRRWDSALYLLIAEKGYDFVSCPAPYTPGNWCGSAGWFPGYPLLLAPLFSVGLPRMLTAVLLSWVFDFGLLMLLWCGFLRDLRSSLRYAALVFAAFAPAGIYMRAVFPMSMTAFFIVAALLLMRHRPLWAGLMVGLAGFCYLTAVVILPVVVVWVFIQARGRHAGQRAALACGTAVLGASGVAAALAMAQVQTGHWNAYFLIQRHYNHGFHFPLTTLWGLIHASFGSSVYDDAIGSSVYGQATEGLEAVLAAFVVVGLLIGVLRLARAQRAEPWDFALIASLMLLWLVPLTQANLSYWRGDTLLVPAALLLPRISRRLALAVTFASCAVFPLLTVTFFEGTLR